MKYGRWLHFFIIEDDLNFLKMEEYLIFLKMEDLLNIWTMEDDPNFLEDLIFFLNGRVAQMEDNLKWKTTSIFLLLEDNLKNLETKKCNLKQIKADFYAILINTKAQPSYFQGTWPTQQSRIYWHNFKKSTSNSKSSLDVFLGLNYEIELTPFATLMSRLYVRICGIFLKGSLNHLEI